MLSSTNFTTLSIINTFLANLNSIALSRPGTQSIFTPKEGIAQECNTSAEVTITRIGTSTGRYNGLSTSNNRKHLVVNLLLES